MTRRVSLTPSLILIVGFLTVCPVLMLVLGSFSEGFGSFGVFTVQKYVEAYTDPALAGILINTLIFTLGSAVVATIFALFLAYINTRTNIPFKFLFGIISIIPMMIPHILFAVSWVLLLNPSNGIRSEEHTSELQSHSFISYAVFCLKKKRKKFKFIRR